MAKKEKDLRTKAQKHEEDEFVPEREEQLVTREDLQDTLGTIFNEVRLGFENQLDRVDSIASYWDIFNCVLGSNQFYNGKSQIFVPIVRDAIRARKTRFVNQMFPANGNLVGCLSTDSSQPHGIKGLLTHYVTKAKLRTQVVPALLVAGDVEGQYSIYVDWVETERHVTFKSDVETGFGLQMDMLMSEEGEPVHDVTPSEEELVNEVVTHAYPRVEIISDSDLLVVPATAASLEEAVANGGSVTVRRYWSKTKVKQLVEDGVLEEEAGDELAKSMKKIDDSEQYKDIEKDQAKVVGIRKDQRGTHVIVFETWAKLNIDGEKRLCRMFFGGSTNFLACTRNPHWSDKLPILSEPIEKIKGSFKGQSQVEAVAALQYYANDVINEGADSSQFALMPIVMTDPTQNPRTGSMVLNMAAIWECSPKDTQFVNFPPLWRDALEIVANVKGQIQQSLSVNPAMITGTSGSQKKKPSQAEVSQEQQIDILTTSDAVAVPEQGILTPMLQRFVELDHQYRDDEIMIPQFGVMGIRASMERIPPIRFDRQYHFYWRGTEQTRSVQLMQQQISALNIVKGIPKELYKGYTLDLAPAIVMLMENTFGPYLAPLIFKSERENLTIQPDKENELLTTGLEMPVHMMDEHEAHMQSHMQAARDSGDPYGTVRAHMAMHQQAMQAAMQARAMQGGGAPGPQPGAPPPGMGGPRPGAQPMPPRGMQAPPGAIHQDQLQDPGRMPQ
jgi:hypothetical protein